jgi:hypothetical protein
MKPKLEEKKLNKLCLQCVKICKQYENTIIIECGKEKIIVNKNY